MQALIPFILPVSGMGNGVHHFDFQVDNDFFAAFEDSPVKQGNLQAQLDFDKQAAMYVMEFAFDGTVEVACNRCLENFALPVNGETRLLVKFGEEPIDADPDVIYIPYGTVQLNVAQYLYEIILLSIPLAPTHDDADEDCNPEMLAFLQPASETDSTEADDDAAQGSPWNALKDFKSN